MRCTVGKYSQIKKNKKTHQAASYFRISDYVKSTSISAYSLAFGLINGTLLFFILEIVSLTPGILESINPILIKLIVKTFGAEWKEFAETINSQLSLYFIPFTMAIIIIAIEFPQLNFVIDQFRRFAQRTIGFRQNAQLLVDNAYLLLSEKIGAAQIEQALENAHSNRSAPRPRELALDPVRLAKYQILYFSTYDAPTTGLDLAIKKLLGKFDIPFGETSSMQYFNVNKVVICAVAYMFVILLFSVFAQSFTNLFSQLSPFIKTWPPVTDLLIELSRWSFQITVPLVVGVALYELSLRSGIVKQLKSGFKSGLAFFQITYGITVGICFHLLDLWRSAVGKPPTIKQYLDIYRLSKAIIPCITAPFLFWIWTLKPSSSRSVLAIAILLSAGVGGFMLFLLQAVFEKLKPEPDTYTYNEFMVGSFQVGLILTLWFLLRRKTT